MVQLGEICTKASSNIAQKDLENYDGIYPIYGASGLIKYVDFYQQETPYVAVVKDGAGVGRVMCLPAKSSVIGTMQYIVPNAGVDVNYLAFAIEHMNLAKYYTGATIPHIYFKDYCTEKLPSHSVDEQHQIALTLNKLSDLISLRKQQLIKLDELVKARFVEMFGDPVSNPLQWKKQALKTNATLLNGRAFKQEELLDSGQYPVLRVGNFFSNRGWFYSDLELEDDKYCDSGDLLYAWSASFGPQIWNGGKVIYHYHIWKVLVGDAYNKEFLCKLLDYATSSFMGDTHGIAMMHLTKSAMEKVMFIVPPLELQQQFSTFVQRSEKSKLTILQNLDKLELLKKSLMQQYFGAR